MKTLNDITQTLNLIQIQSKRNWMQIGGERIENLLMNMVSKTKERAHMHTHTHTQIHASLFENGLTKFQTRIWYDKILWDFIVVLPKPTPMNHCHHN